MKSLFLTSPGRCGTHWLGNLLRGTLGLEKEIHLPYNRAKAGEYVQNIKEIKAEDKIYIKHVPIGMLRSLLPENNIVAIVRNPKDTIVSAAYYTTSRNEKDIQQCQENFGGDHFFDKRYNLMLKHFIYDGFHLDWYQSYVENYLKVAHVLVRFEDLVQDTETELSIILSSLGVNIPDNIGEVVSSNSFKRLAGRPLGQEDTRDHFRKGIIGDWKNHMTLEESKRVDNIYKDFNDILGY